MAKRIFKISVVSCSDTDQEAEENASEKNVENSDLDYELHFVD